MENAEAGVTRRKKTTQATVKVLLVDDSTENLRLFKTILESRGYEVATAANGEEALLKLRKSPADLIVSDILMPVMDGFLFLKQCKANAKFKGIRFVFLTATYMDKEDEELALKLGTDAFIRKPVEPEDLLNKLEEVLASTPAPKKRGRKPKAEKADQGNLYNLSLTQKLEKKMQDLEAEITGRHKIEDELRLSEDRYRLLFETMAQGVVYQSADGHIISANPAAARILGLTLDQLVSKTSYDPGWRAVHEDGSDFPGNEHPAIVSLKTAKPVRDTVMGVFNTADDIYHWININAEPLFRPGEDKPYQVYTTFEDITGRQLSFKALQESESRMAAILENTLDAICSVDTEFRLIAANSAARKLYEGLFGAPLNEGIDIRSVMPQERKDFWNGIGARVFKGEHVVLENRYELAVGPVDLEFSLTPIISHASSITGISIFARDITSRKKMEKQLKESEEIFRKAVQSTTDIVWDWDIGSGHLEWYGDIDSMLGYSAGEFPRTLEAWENALHPDDHDHVIAALNRHAETGEIYNVEYRILRRDGTQRNWIDRGLVIRDEGGRIIRSVGACVDITEHRQSEAMARIRRDLALKLAGRIDMQTALRHCLDAAIEISSFDTGVIYILDEKSGDFKSACYHGGSAFLLEHYSVLKADSVDARLIKKGRPLYVKAGEFTPPFDEQLKQEGFTFDATIPVLYQGQVIASLGIFSHTQDTMPAVIRNSLEAIAADIGVIIDRLASRQALQASEERYRFITDHTADVIWVLDKSLHYTFVSPSVTRLRGFTVDEAMAHDIIQQITSASMDELVKAIESVSIPALGGMAGQEQWLTRELEMYRKDGSAVWMETSMTTITDEKGEFNGLLGISRDISARRQAEQSLRESEEKYRLVVENAREAIIVAQDGLLKFANQNTAVITGYSKEELTSMPFINPIHPDDRQMVIERHLRRLKGELFEEVYPFRVINKDGRVGWVEIQAVKIDWEGRPATLNFLTEITERKLAEEALRQSEEQYRLLVESANEIVLVAQDGIIKFVNTKASEVTGYTHEELTGRSFAEITHPDDLSLVVERYQRRLKGEVIPGMKNYRVVRKDGKVIQVELSGVTIEWEGRPATLNFINDITARLQAEKDIQQRAALLDSAYDSIIAYDMDGKIIYANQTACSIRGFSRDEMLAMNMRQLVPDEELPGLEERHRQLLEQGELSSEAVHNRKDSSTFIVDTHLRLADLAGDKLVIAVQRDITLRKQMENRLVESEAKYRSIVDTSASGIAIADEAGTLVLVNDRLCDMFGYSRDEVMGKQFLDFVHPQERDKIAGDFFEAVVSSKTLPALEFRGVRKDGNTIWLFTTPNPLKMGDHLIGFSVVIQDITQLKQAETALRQSEEKYRTVVENMHDVLYRTDNTGDIILVSPAVTRLLGVESAGQVIGKNLARDFYADPEDRARTLELLEAKGEVVDLEVNLRRPDGKLITVADSSHIYRDASGQPAGIEGLIRDITERKKAEEDLRTALERLGSSLESTIDAIAMMSELRDPYTAGHQRRVTHLALAIAAELELPDDRMQPLRVAGLLHDVGKIYVPSEILSKPGRLTDLEMGLARAHVAAGYDVLAAIKFPWPIADIVVQHHERMDGSGYPTGLKGDEITPEARILAVADVTEAMMSHRPYRPALGIDKALAEITANRGRLYDEKAVDACIKLLTEKGFKFPD